MYKGSNNGLNALFAFSYTGDRIYTVSRYIDNDLWQKPFWKIDLSIEKKITKHLNLYLKAKNLLNAHIKVYIKKNNPLNNDVPFHSSNDQNKLIRDEYNMQSYLIGLRYKY